MGSGLGALRRPGMTACSKSQDRLGDDVPLDLVRAAIDRDLAPVEVGRRDRACPVGADRRLVLAVLRLLLVWQGVGTDDLHQQLGRRLLDLRALDLEDRGGRVGLALLAMALGRDDAQLRHLQRLELDLDRGELLAEAGRLDQRHLADALDPGELLDAAEALLRDPDAGDADALVAEQELGVVPALVLLPDEVLGRHAHVVEEDLVDLLAAVDGLDRADRDAGRLHVDEEEGDALLLLRRHVGAGQDEDPVGVLPERRPGLLAGDDVIVAVALRRRLERGEVGAGAGLGEALAPPVVEIGDARQEAALLRLRAEGDDHRPDHADAERQRRGRRRLLHLVLEDVLPHRVPAGAAPLDRPMRHRPALGVEDAGPFDELVLRGVMAHDELVADALRQRGAEEFADFLAEGVFLGGEAEVHAGLLFLFSVVSQRESSRAERSEAGAVDPGSPLRFGRDDPEKDGTGAHDASRIAALARSSSTSSFFESLPTAVRGRWSRMSSAAGISCRPILSARKARSASSVSGGLPSRSLTKAFAASPR